MDFSNESLYLYSLLFRVGLADFSEFNVWLDKEFLQDKYQNELLIELEYATNNLNKTLQILDEYLSEKLLNLDIDLLGRMLTDYIRNIYMQPKFNIEEIAKDLYGVWHHLPHNICEQEPFHMMSYIDDPLSYGDKAQTVDLLERFISYYEPSKE